MGYTRTCVSFAGFDTYGGHVSFRVKDSRGPCIQIHSTSGGNQRVKQEFFVTPEMLKELAACFTEAANHEYKTRQHYNSGEPLRSLVQGDIDEYGDVCEFGMSGWGEGEASNYTTLPNRGYKLTDTLTVDDCATPPHQMVPGTVSGRVERMGVEVQTFVVREDGEMVFEPIGTPLIYVVSGRVDHVTKKATVTWNDRPGANYLHFDYKFTTPYVI